MTIPKHITCDSGCLSHTVGLDIYHALNVLPHDYYSVIINAPKGITTDLICIRFEEYVTATFPPTPDLLSTSTSSADSKSHGTPHPPL